MTPYSSWTLTTRCSFSIVRTYTVHGVGNFSWNLSVQWSEKRKCHWMQFFFLSSLFLVGVDVYFISSFFASVFILLWLFCFHHWLESHKKAFPSRSSISWCVRLFLLNTLFELLLYLVNRISALANAECTSDTTTDNSCNLKCCIYFKRTMKTHLSPLICARFDSFYSPPLFRPYTVIACTNGEQHTHTNEMSTVFDKWFKSKLNGPN